MDTNGLKLILLRDVREEVVAHDVGEADSERKGRHESATTLPVWSRPTSHQWLSIFF